MIPILAAGEGQNIKTHAGFTIVIVLVNVEHISTVLENKFIILEACRSEAFKLVNGGFHPLCSSDQFYLVMLQIPHCADHSP